MEVTNRQKILVVDDEPTIRELLGCVLSESGYDVTAARSGRECVDQVAENVYDLVLMDLDMPDWDGRTAIKAIHQGKPGLKVIVVSAVHNTNLEELLRECPNVVGWVNKPFELDALHAEIGRALG